MLLIHVWQSKIRRSKWWKSLRRSLSTIRSMTSLEVARELTEVQERLREIRLVLWGTCREVTSSLRAMRFAISSVTTCKASLREKIRTLTLEQLELTERNVCLSDQLDYAVARRDELSGEIEKLHERLSMIQAQRQIRAHELEDRNRQLALAHGSMQRERDAAREARNNIKEEREKDRAAHRRDKAAREVEHSVALNEKDRKYSQLCLELAHWHQKYADLLEAIRLDGESLDALKIAYKLYDKLTDPATGLSEEQINDHTPNVRWSPVTLSLHVGDRCVWDDQTRAFDLTYDKILGATMLCFYNDGMVAKALEKFV